MNMTRNIKSAVNRRANEVARQLLPMLVARMTGLIESGELALVDIETWWPADVDLVQACAHGEAGDYLTLDAWPGETDFFSKAEARAARFASGFDPLDKF